MGFIKDKLKKDSSYYKNPAQHLNNIFVNMSQTENSNQPKCIKHKRRNNFQDSESEYSSSGEDSSLSQDDADDIINAKQRKSKTESNEQKKNSKLLIEKIVRIDSIKHPN